MIKEFKLPDLGEGLTESEILSWQVGEGENVELNQIIAEVETAKAVVEIPCPYAGVVRRLHESPGTVVKVGMPIISIEVEGSVGEGTAGVPASEVPTGRVPTLVGYGAEPKSAGGPRRRKRASATESARVPANEQRLPERQEPEQHEPEQRVPKAAPPVRKLARDLKVDLTKVIPDATNGIITREEVLAAHSALDASSAENSHHTSPGVGQEDLDSRILDQERLNPDAESVTHVPIKGVRKYTAQAMVASAFSAPHVTEFLTVDVTESMALLSTLKASSDYAGLKLSPLTLAAKALTLALSRQPSLNSSWDEEAQEILLYRNVNLGFAAATERGLLVPVIPHANSLNLPALAAAITELSTLARAGTLSPGQMSGGTITITNVGVFGVDAGTPIITPGQAAILAMGAVRKMPWEYRGGIALREVMTLSLSFDHRLVDGEQGSRFLADIGNLLSHPELVWGWI